MLLVEITSVFDNWGRLLPRMSYHFMRMSLVKQIKIAVLSFCIEKGGRCYILSLIRHSVFYWGWEVEKVCLWACSVPLMLYANLHLHASLYP